MKKRTYCYAVLALVACGWPGVVGAETEYYFTAYNDFSWAAPQLSNNITLYTTGDEGQLIDFETGEGVAAYLCVTGGTSGNTSVGGLMPGTEAYEFFHDNVTCTGSMFYTSDIILTFEGLEPAVYELVLYADRGSPSYVDRYNDFIISDVDHFRNVSSTGTTISTTTLPNDTTTYCAGYNTTNGYVARFDQINPGGNGAFVVTVTGYKFYLNAMMLRAYSGDFVADGYALSAPPAIEILSVSNRYHSNLVDINYRVTDADSATVEVRGFAVTNTGASAGYLEGLIPLATLVEGTDSEYGEGVIPTNTTKLLTWDAGTDVGQSVADMKVHLLACDTTNLPLSLHFVTVPADTNGPSFKISRYAGTASLAYQRGAVRWALLKGMVRTDANEVYAVGGSHHDQLLLTDDTLTDDGKGWFAANLACRLATTQEVQRAQEATTPGSVTKWPAYDHPMYVNEYAIETGRSNTFYFARD